MAGHWGRRETVITPPRLPVLTYAALLSLPVLAGIFAMLQMNFFMTPLQRTYIVAYVRATFGSVAHHSSNYRLVYLQGPKVRPRLALPVDFRPGQTRLQNGRISPVQLSELPRAQGYTSFQLGPPAKFNDASLKLWLRGAFYHGRSLAALFSPSLIGATVCALPLIWFAVRSDWRRRLVLKYGRLLRGPTMMTPAEFSASQLTVMERMRNVWAWLSGASETQSLGVGFRTTEFNGLMRIPRSKEAQHIMLMGDTGAGKSTLILQLLRQIRDRGELAIINDPGGEFLSRFYDQGRGDYVLNPLDARMPFWSPAMELTRNEEALTIANSLYQPTSANSTDNKEFFFRTAAQIFAELLKDGPTTQELVERIADENGLQERFQGTEKEYYVRRSASNQATGVLSTLGLVADTLRLLPSRDNTTRTWNATDWTKSRRGWIFITYEERHADVLLPLISLWIDILVMRLLHSPQPGQKKVWFAIDELASLQRLPQLHTALTKSRKSKNPLIIGLQGRSQVEDIYGKVAEVMLSQAATKVFLRTTEPKSALWISDTIGKVEIERLRETRYDGNRHGHNYTVDRQIEPLVMDSEINGLADLHAFLKLDNAVTRFQFPVMEMPTVAEKFIERHSPESALRFERESLTAHRHVASRSKASAPKSKSDRPADAQQTLPLTQSQEPVANHSKQLPMDASSQSGKQDELVTI